MNEIKILMEVLSYYQMFGNDRWLVDTLVAWSRFYSSQRNWLKIDDELPYQYLSRMNN
jgi:hypothetical protein